jgi:S1-C subfamily serine protease
MTPAEVAQAQQLSRTLAQRIENRAKTGAPVSPAQPVPGQRTLSRTLVAKVQRHLKALDYDAGPIDGIQVKKTIAAVKAFQRDLKLLPTGVISQELLVLLEGGLAAKRQTASVEPEKQRKLAGSGSGFVVNDAGYALTNHHVIEDCNVVTVSVGGKRQQAKVEATDPANDLALLRLSVTPVGSASFSESRRVLLGQPVFVSGYPLSGLLADDLNFTDGNVSAVAA